MQVTKFIKETQPPTPKSTFTEEELKQDYNYYLAQQLLNSLLKNGLITEGELHKITKINRQTFSPSLGQIMPRIA
ncbi:MAG: SHOCT domain-containing protein [Anaerotignaceae bacterium]